MIVNRRANIYFMHVEHINISRQTPQNKQMLQLKFKPCC